jgi:hypothetical protein
MGPNENDGAQQILMACVFEVVRFDSGSLLAASALVVKIAAFQRRCGHKPRLHIVAVSFRIIQAATARS